jgi:hypothetical protein
MSDPHPVRLLADSSSYRLQCAFEIEIQTFRESLEDPDPNNQPHEALLNAIALMACYYDQTLREANRAQIFVERTRHCLQNSLTGVRTRKVVQQIQAGHLLCKSCCSRALSCADIPHSVLPLLDRQSPRGPRRAGQRRLPRYVHPHPCARAPMTHNPSPTVQSPQDNVLGLAEQK